VLFAGSLALAGSPAAAQVFHFNNTSTTLQLDVTASPAHWYIEIFNDVGVDTTLRWKSNFVNIPGAWTIQFDVETALFTNIKSGDSADFILADSLLFPQKLIIGAFTNNTPATGSVFFDIYLPSDPAGKVTIEFFFIITPVGVGEGPQGAAAVIAPGMVFFSDRVPTPYSVLSADGRILADGVAQPGWQALDVYTPGLYILRWHTPGGMQRHKIFVTGR
jgi:hypothetical protein